MDGPTRPRLVPEWPLPPYSYVPGSGRPHPVSDPAGHSFGRRAESASPEDWRSDRTYLYGFDLFNAGFYWEAHEAWEACWHAHGRRGPSADVLKGLIKLAAAGVKVRERQPRGVTTHARRAAECFRSAAEQGGARRLGLDLARLATIAEAVADDPPADGSEPGVAVLRVFGFGLEPGSGAAE